MHCSNPTRVHAPCLAPHVTKREREGGRERGRETGEEVFLKLVLLALLWGLVCVGSAMAFSLIYCVFHCNHTLHTSLPSS